MAKELVRVRVRVRVRVKLSLPHPYPYPDPNPSPNLGKGCDEGLEAQVGLVGEEELAPGP